MEFYIKNMICYSCTKSVTEAIQSADPNAKVATDPGARKVTVHSHEPVSVLEKVLEEAGYPAKQLD